MSETLQGCKDWDELVDTELHHQRLATLSDLRQAGRVSFKRCYAEGLNGDKVKSVQLHCFADASERLMELWSTLE